jgi:hypothetical protein
MNAVIIGRKDRLQFVAPVNPLGARPEPRCRTGSHWDGPRGLRVRTVGAGPAVEAVRFPVAVEQADNRAQRRHPVKRQVYRL